MLHVLTNKRSRSTRAVLALAAVLSVGVPLQTAVAATKGVYVGGEFYPPTTEIQDLARNSGFTRLFYFTLGVETNGNITVGGNTICQNGSYVGNPDWGAGLAACKAPPSSVDRIEICIGSWGSQAFNNIKSLIAAQGAGSGSILYRNFQALKNATNADAIQFDDELTYDVNSMVAFGNMLYGLGFKVTLCPYTQQAFWVNVKNQLGSKVDAIYLQCYDGGAGNNPISWNAAFGGFKVTPGLWGNVDNATSVMTKMRNWNSAAGGLPGGFMWLNGSLPTDGWKTSTGLCLGLDEPFYIIQNRQTGLVLNLPQADTGDGTPIQTYQFNYNDTASRFAITPSATGDRFYLLTYLGATAVDMVAGSTSNGALAENRALYTSRTDQWWDLVDAGNGYYRIRNAKSGKVLESVGTTNFSNVYQTTDTGANAQQWRMIPHGQYYLRADHGGKYVSVQGGSGNGVVQYDYQSQPWFRWKFLNKSSGWFAVSTMNGTNRVIQVNNGSTANGAYLDLYDYVPTNPGNQEVRLRFKLDRQHKFYFRHTGKSWDIGGGSQANNAPLSQYSDTSNAWQNFKMERVQD